MAFMAIREDAMDYREREVRARVDGARELLGPVLTNTLPAFFDNIAEALSPRHPRTDGAADTNAAAVHGGERARMTPFGADQVAHEYQIFREAIAVTAKGRVELDDADWAIVDESINRAAREAIKAFSSGHEELRRKLAAALSHDMRTPLAVIVSGAQLVGIAPNMETARRAATKIESNANRLRDMMEELLEALTLQGGARLPLTIERFDAYDLVSHVRDQYTLSQANGVKFQALGDSVIGHWCRSSMRRAVENLVNNAIKYGDNSVVTMQTREARGRLMLSVHNEGNPIPEERHNRIFDYLRREEEPGSVAGWGIGLQFVRTVAESHGGSVTVDSSPETGTTFLIDVPVDCRPFI